MMRCTMSPLCMTRNHPSNVGNCARAPKVASRKAVLPSVGWCTCMMMCRQHFWTCAQFHAQNVGVNFPAARWLRGLRSNHHILRAGSGNIHVVHGFVKWDEMCMHITILVKCLCSPGCLLHGYQNSCVYTWTHWEGRLHHPHFQRNPPYFLTPGVHSVVDRMGGQRSLLAALYILKRRDSCTFSISSTKSQSRASSGHSICKKHFGVV